MFAPDLIQLALKRDIQTLSFGNLALQLFFKTIPLLPLVFANLCWWSMETMVLLQIV